MANCSLSVAKVPSWGWWGWEKCGELLFNVGGPGVGEARFFPFNYL
jgi:hypothetical protein